MEWLLYLLQSVFLPVLSRSSAVLAFGTIIDSREYYVVGGSLD